MREGAEQQEQTWARLMTAAQDGDSRAYEDLLRGISPFIRALARRRITAPDRIEDLVQEVLLCVHRVRHTYDPSRPFTPWLAAIVSRRSIDALRRGSRIARFETPEESGSETFVAAPANNELEAADSTRQLDDLLAGLPPGQRTAVEMLKLREMSLLEASAASGYSVAALKVSMHRALKTLRARWAASASPEPGHEAETDDDGKVEHDERIP